MTVIAYKKRGIGIMYFICAIVGLIAMGIAIPFIDEAIIIAIFGLIVTVISSYIFISYICLPREIILIDQENVLHLPKGIKVNLNDIYDVSYRRASAKGIQYKWGSVTLNTRLGKFKYGYIADCEDVAKYLTKLTYQLKYQKLHYE